MESLLRWSIENTSSQDSPMPPPEPRKDVDPGLIDAILGKPDSELMKEALAIGTDSTLDTETRVTALDDLEMLVEQIDNAMNLTPLGMYPKILSLLSPQTPDPVRIQALWILGTAVQNNSKAQADFLTYDPLPLILSILSPKDGAKSEVDNTPSAQTRSKAAYALSAALKHSALAVRRLGDVGGWNILRDALKDSDITIRRKIAFLINTLLLPTAQDVSSSASANPAPVGPIIHAGPPPGSSLSNPSAAVTSQSEDNASLPPGVNPTSTLPLTLPAVRTHNIIPTLIESLITPLPHGPDADGDVDPDYVEKAARALLTYLEVGGELAQSEKDALHPIVTDGGSSTRPLWALDQSDWETLRQSTVST